MNVAFVDISSGEKVISDLDLGITVSRVSIGEPEIKETLIEVPYADGMLDCSEFAGHISYKNRPINIACGFTVTRRTGNFADRYSRETCIRNLLHGRKMKIYLSDHCGYYYTGRIRVGEFTKKVGIVSFDIKCNSFPWELKNSTTSVSAELTGEYTTVSLVNDYMPAVPTITVTEDTTLLWNGAEYAISAGTHRLLDIRLTKGVNTISAKLATAASGTITFEYQEGRL